MRTAPHDDFRAERLYYDGIRRIQEVIIDPVLGNSNQGSQSKQEQNQVGGGTATPYLAREYVRGPGDNGFDELLLGGWWAIRTIPSIPTTDLDPPQLRTNGRGGGT